MEQSGHYDHFKEVLKRYLTINNQIKEIDAQMKELKAEMDRLIEERMAHRKALAEKKVEMAKQMEVLEPHIMSFMKKEDIYDINTPMGRIRYKEQKRKKKPTKDDIKERLMTIFDGHDRRDEIIASIYKEEVETTARLQCKFLEE